MATPLAEQLAALAPQITTVTAPDERIDDAPAQPATDTPEHQQATVHNVGRGLMSPIMYDELLQPSVEAVADNAADASDYDSAKRENDQEVAGDVAPDVEVSQPPAPKEEKKAKKKLPLLVSNSSAASQLLEKAFASVRPVADVDGENHINIHNNAATELGRLLDMNAHTPIQHRLLGTFQSAGGLWHYIKTRGVDSAGNETTLENLRQLHGAKLRQEVIRFKNNPNIRTISVQGFRTIICDALALKVQQNPKIEKLLLESGDIVLKHYYTEGTGGIRQYPTEGFWMVECFSYIREILQANALELSKGSESLYECDFSYIETFKDPSKPVSAKAKKHRNPYGGR